MNKVRWLLVGAGDIANKRVIPAIEAEPHSELAAVCDRVRDRAQATAGPRNARVYTELREALESPDIDAVYVCTPVFLHAPQAIAALEAGRHVLVEKPVALDYGQAKELVAAARRTGRKCAAAYFRRFYPRYEMAREMVRKAEFGQMVLVRMTYFSWFNPTKEDPKYWRVVPEKSGGGPLSDMGTHMFDVLIGLFGMPEKVYAKTATLTHDYAVEDSAAAIMTLAGGAQVVASFNWNSKTWSHEFEIIGTEAKVKWHPYDTGSVLKTVGREVSEIEMPNHPNVHYPLIEDFVTAVCEDREPRIPVTEAAKTNRLLDAVYLSARENREVHPAEVQ